MRIVIAAVGKLKAEGERDLFERYAKRIVGGGRAAGISGFELREINESRDPSRDGRMADEAGRLLAKCKAQTQVIALDERGKAFTSHQLAGQIRAIREEGLSELAFLIGGPDGHGDSVRRAARMMLSLSALTLPHGLARVVLAEQIYRATTMITGHPYHRD